MEEAAGEGEVSEVFITVNTGVHYDCTISGGA
jgi:hypothetical protein